MSTAGVMSNKQVLTSNCWSHLTVSWTIQLIGYVIAIFGYLRLNSAFHPSRLGKLSTSLFGCGKAGCVF